MTVSEQEKYISNVSNRTFLQNPKLRSMVQKAEFWLMVTYGPGGDRRL